MNKYHYEVKKLGAGSSRYGKCEICMKHVDTMHYQIESMEHEETAIGNEAAKICLTRYECNSYFGHRECLESVRR